MALSATPCAATAVFAIVCSSPTVSEPVPSLAAAAMPAMTAERLLAVTPVMPTAARSAAVSAGTGLPPAAMSWIALAITAKALISATVSTLVVSLPPMMLLSRSKLAGVVAAAPIFAPTTAYCAAVGFTAALASAAAPLASPNMAL